MFYYWKALEKNYYMEALEKKFSIEMYQKVFTIWMYWKIFAKKKSLYTLERVLLYEYIGMLWESFYFRNELERVLH